MGTKKHTLAEGEWIGQVARAHGFRHWEDIWQHDCNAELRAVRGSASLLRAGDVLRLPEPERARAVRVRTGTRVTFQVRPRDEVRISIDGIAGYLESFGPIPFSAKAGGDPVAGQLTEEGQEIVVPIEHGDQEVEVELLGATRTYRLGDVGPAAERCGAFERLRNLGHSVDSHHAPIDARNDLDDEHLMHALLAFQRRYGLPVTGELDEATRDTLTKAYGV